MLAAILQEEGYKTGLYTSPHLKDFRERIRINGEMIAEAFVIDFVDRTDAITKSLIVSAEKFSPAAAQDAVKPVIDNVKAWSGDHCVDPRLVPGILFCNHQIDRQDPALIDVAPTALRLFGLEPPPYMEGRPLFESAGRFNGAGVP